MAQPRPQCTQPSKWKVEQGLEDTRCGRPCVPGRDACVGHLNQALSLEETAELRERAQVLWEQTGTSERKIARELAVAHSTVRRWAEAGGWVRFDPEEGPAGDRQLALARRRAADAQAGAAVRWARVREQEADAAGQGAVQLRELLLLAAVDEHSREGRLRALTAAYQALVQTAQLLSGGDTDRQALAVTDAGPSAVEEAQTVQELRSRNLERARGLTLLQPG